MAGALYLPSGALPQLLQGCLANGSFLGALAAVACHPDLLLDLIVSDEQAAAGCFTLKVLLRCACLVGARVVGVEGASSLRVRA